MSEQPPQLIAALVKADQGEFGPILGLAFRARDAQDEGRYCECTDPHLAGDDLMCGACLLNNKDQERKRCAAICEAHDFVPGDLLEGFFCAICTNPEDAPRHHGVNATPRYSWGSDG